MSKYGGPSGGIAVFVRERYCDAVKRVDEGFKFAVILEVKGMRPGNVVQSENMIIVCTYLPPQNSSAYTEETNGVLVLREKLVELKANFLQHTFVILRYLNASVGELQDTLNEDGIEHITGLEWYEPDEFDEPRHCCK